MSSVTAADEYDDVLSKYAAARDADAAVLATSDEGIFASNQVTESWSEMSWSDISYQLTTSRNLPALFWLTQALGLVVMMLTVWGTSNLWHRYADARAGRIIDRYLDVVEMAARPASRAVNRALAVAIRSLPVRYRGTHGQWQLLGDGTTVVCISFLAVQFYCVARGGASVMGPHRSELPTLAVGTARVRWGCGYLRISDGALPQRLAALPLEASVRAPSSWTWWVLNPWLTAPETGQVWSDSERWRASLAIATNGSDSLNGDGAALCVDDARVWTFARALLWGRGAADGAVTTDDSSSAVDMLLADARASAVALVGLPLFGLCTLISWRLWDRAGALLTATLCALCPQLLCHTPRLTADTCVATLLHATLWGYWSLLHATTPSALLVAGGVTAVLVGLLVSAGPLASVAAPAAACLTLVRIAAIMIAALASLCDVGGRHRTPSEAAAGDAPLARRPSCQCIGAFIGTGMGVCLAMPTAAGGVAATVAAVPLWPTDGVQKRADEAAWDTATARLRGTREGCRVAPARKSKKRGGKKKGGTRRHDDVTANEGSLPAGASSPPSPLSPIACLLERGVGVPALLAAAEWAHATGIVPRLLLTLCIHHVAAVAELANGADGEWDQPTDAAAMNATLGSSLLYKSGVFAQRREAAGTIGDAATPFANFHLLTALLKTPPTLLYLLLLLIIAASRAPSLAALKTVGVPLMIAVFARALRSSTIFNWAAQRYARLTRRSEWQRQVATELDKLLQKRRPAQRARSEAPTDAPGAPAQSTDASSPLADGADGEDSAEATTMRDWSLATRRQLYRTAPLWALVGGYALLLSAGAPPAAGHRLLLPLYPALYILLGALGPLATDTRKYPLSQPLVLVSALLLTSLFGLESMALHPLHGAYFAPVAGGRTGGHFHLLGDSLDTGADLPTLASWLADSARVDEPAYLAYCGEDSPRARSIHARRLPAQPHAACVTAATEPFDTTPPNPARAPSSTVGAHGDNDAIDGPAELWNSTSAADDEISFDDEVLFDGLASLEPSAGVLSAQAETMRDAGGGVLAVATLDDEEQAVLLPGLYVLEANALHGLSSAFIGPWTDLAESAYQLVLRHGLHARFAASPLRFARLCAMLRKLQPLATVGHALLIWRLTDDELRLASHGEPAEIFPSRALSPGVRRLQHRFVARTLEALGVARWSSDSQEQLE